MPLRRTGSGRPAKLGGMPTTVLAPRSPNESPASAGRPAAPAESRALASAIERFTPTDGIHTTAIPRLTLARVSAPTEPAHAVHLPAVCFIAQGRKRVMLGGEPFDYDAAHHLVVSLDLPISGQILEASTDAPYLSFRLDFDPGDIAAMLLEMEAPPPATQRPARGVFVSRTQPALLDAALRLLQLLATPEDIPTLAPLAAREILYRLLKSEEGWRLSQLAGGDGQARRIARAIGWLKANYDKPLRIEEVAREVHMSTSSLHHHFKAATALSPLQYQKQLRLREARRLLLSNEAADAATACHRVGYESPSQFSREYRRLFGAPPVRDLQRMRSLPQATA